MARSIFANLFLSKFQPTDQELAKLYANSPLLLEKINTEIQRFDLGIESMRVINISDMPALFFDHINFQKPIPWLFESHGTKYFIEIFPDIAFALDSGGTAVIDELDLSIHPNALPEILRWFHCNERNPYGAQIWMTCQNASLLEELEKEEVYFCEKDTRGATFIHGLRDIIGIRRSENFYKAYLGGEYGAVPHIG
jgi:predicted ATPase